MINETKIRVLEGVYAASDWNQLRVALTDEQRAQHLIVIAAVSHESLEHVERLISSKPDEISCAYILLKLEESNDEAEGVELKESIQ